MKIDPAWHKQQVNLYIEEFPHYQQYADVLLEVLGKACKTIAPLAIVQARPKSVSSFAEKAVRKAHKYKEPVRQITDLCGARVITRIQEEADEICQFIRENFAIDEANSLDTRTRLKVSEFDYLSVHFVVQVRRPQIMGVPIPLAEIGDRKAEIQVRTLLQHAWADITHDRLYKSEFKVPEQFRRDGAVLAAAMENADGGFARFEEGFGAYLGNYAAYMNKARMRDEMSILALILNNEPKEENRPQIALRLGKVGNAWGSHEAHRRVIKTLERFRGTPGPLGDAIRLELGRAYLNANPAPPMNAEHRRGRDLLEQVADSSPDQGAGKKVGQTRAKALRSEAKALLARSYCNVRGRQSQARDLYRQALELEPSNPYHLVSLLEYEVFCTRRRDFLAAMRPAMLDAVATCRAHADVGIELPRAFLTMGKLHLLLGQYYESLAAYAKAVQFCNLERGALTQRECECELEFLDRINAGAKMPPQHQWVRELLLLAKSVSMLKRGLCRELKGRVLKKGRFKRPILMVVGGADPALEVEMRRYRDYVEEALTGLEGTVLCGGTTSGIPGIVGAVTDALRVARTKRFTSIGYLPRKLPADARRDERYDRLILAGGKGLSFHEPLQTWIDLLAAGVSPKEVKVLGINGGRIAAFEYRLALALGAPVGVVEYTGRAAPELLADHDWAGAPNLVRLPADAMTVVAFANPLRMIWPRPVLDKLGRIVHETYCKANEKNLIDPSMLRWERLRDDLKESNRQQAAYAARTLRRGGYGVRRARGPIALPTFTDDEIEIMAEAEHGRWNAERLAAGWRWGRVRDVANRINPALVPWRELPDEIKVYDRKAVKELPAVLKEAGMEVYKIEPGNMGAK